MKCKLKGTNLKWKRKGTKIGALAIVAAIVALICLELFLILYLHIAETAVEVSIAVALVLGLILGVKTGLSLSDRRHARSLGKLTLKALKHADDIRRLYGELSKREEASTSAAAHLSSFPLPSSRDISS